MISKFVSTIVCVCVFSVQKSILMSLRAFLCPWRVESVYILLLSQQKSVIGAEENVRRIGVKEDKVKQIEWIYCVCMCLGV